MLRRRVGINAIGVFAWIAVLVALAAPANAACGSGSVLVFSAASLTDAVTEFAEHHARKSGCAVTVSTAASSTLARQIDAGAPAGVFLSANPEWTDWLAENAPDRIAGAPVAIASNALVIVSKNAASSAGNSVSLLNGRFAMGDPSNVPAGLYAMAALQSLGLWEAVTGNAVFTENVRVALALASRGEVAAAIVYATDAMLDPSLAIAHTFDPAIHPAIIHSGVALAAGGDSARNFLEALTGADGQAVLARHGFLPARSGS